MTKRNIEKYEIPYPTMEEYVEANKGISLAEVMRQADKQRQQKSPASFKKHYVVINTLGELWLVKPKDIGAFL